MKRKIIVVSALLTAVLAGGYSVQAGPVGMGCRNQHAVAGQQGCRPQMNCKEDGGCFGHFSRMADSLGLSESQRQEIEGVVVSQQDVNAPLMERISEGRRQLMEASRSGVMDETQIADLAAEQGKLMGELMVARIRMKSQIFALLTPEQQNKAGELCEGCDGGPGCGAGAGCGLRCNEQMPDGAGDHVGKGHGKH